jgi:hypothetical protein
MVKIVINLFCVLAIIGNAKEIDLGLETFSDIEAKVQNSMQWKDGHMQALNRSNVITYEIANENTWPLLEKNLIGNGMSPELTGRLLHYLKKYPDPQGKLVFQVGTTVFVGAEEALTKTHTYTVAGLQRFYENGETILFIAQRVNNKIQRIDLSDGTIIITQNGSLKNYNVEHHLLDQQNNVETYSIAMYKDGKLVGTTVRMNTYGAELLFDENFNLMPETFESLRHGYTFVGYTGAGYTFTKAPEKGGFILIDKATGKKKALFSWAGCKLILKDETPAVGGAQEVFERTIRQKVTLNIPRFGSSKGDILTYDRRTKEHNNLQISEIGTVSKTVTRSNLLGQILEDQKTYNCSSDAKHWYLVRISNLHTLKDMSADKHGEQITILMSSNVRDRGMRVWTGTKEGKIYTEYPGEAAVQTGWQEERIVTDEKTGKKFKLLMSRGMQKSEPWVGTKDKITYKENFDGSVTAISKSERGRHTIDGIEYPVEVHRPLGIKGDDTPGTYTFAGITYQEVNKRFEPISVQEWGMVNDEVVQIQYDARKGFLEGKPTPGVCQMSNGDTYKQEKPGGTTWVKILERVYTLHGNEIVAATRNPNKKDAQWSYQTCNGETWVQDPKKGWVRSAVSTDK